MSNFYRLAGKRVAAAIGLLTLASFSLSVVRATLPRDPAAHDTTVAARFRGCASAGWCRFHIESGYPTQQSILRVFPDGVPCAPQDAALSLAIRDRLNMLLASMIHQHKRILLHDLREIDDGVFAAAVTVNELNVAADPVIRQLREQIGHGGR